jgi:putative membrane protein
MNPQTRGDARDYLAAERTFLAWIRTGLALMGFGFVVARFGLFLQALHITEPRLQTGANGPSVWFGTALIVLGVLVNLLSARRHLRLIKNLNQGELRPQGHIALGIAVALVLALVGLAMAAYLISVRTPPPLLH